MSTRIYLSTYVFKKIKQSLDFNIYLENKDFW